MLPPLSIGYDILDLVSNGNYHAPHDVLGPHSDGTNLTIRVLRHLADSVVIETATGKYEATHEFNGIWYAVLEGTEVPDYRVRAKYGEFESVTDDGYRFLPTIGEVDLYLFSEGRHERLWEVLGAHLHTYESELGPVHGTSFAVWAPNAKAVRVMGDFNSWNGAVSAMRTMGTSGVWELFIPGAYEGARYKYEIQFQDGSWHQKADPYAQRTEIPPSTASIITKSDYEWTDDEWMTERAKRDPHTGPISIYEVHLGSWRLGLDFEDMAQQLIGHVKYLGFTHVEFMPLSEHPYGPSWGYQVSGYYAPTARFGTPDQLRYLIDELHKAGIGVIMDWVPAHFPKDDWALARFDGTPLYEDPNPHRGEHPDWGTYIFNFGRREVKNFLVANALYWLEEFHIDGIRVDAVASMLYLDYSREAGQWEPNMYGGRENLEAIAFIQESNATAYHNYPGIMMIAEESTSWEGVTAMTSDGGLGYGLKWNMGWMNDTLRYMQEKPINRRWHHGEITFSLVYAFSEKFCLPLSHDEVVHGKGSLYSKMPGNDWEKLAGVRLLYGYQWSHPGKQLLFMGQEFAQINEWNEGAGLDWWLTDNPNHDGVMSCVARLNQVYREHPALWSDDFTYHGYEWIDGSDGDNNVLTYLRKSNIDDDIVVVAANFSGQAHFDYRVGFPFPGEWEEIMNTDAVEYGGSGVGNMGTVETEDVPWNGRAQSALLQLPPLGVVYFAPKKADPEVIDADAAEEAEATDE
ncbi:MAG: 1,4-alpha-glucan branching protein GlgB [Arcanobacterium sp.]